MDVLMACSGAGACAGGSNVYGSGAVWAGTLTMYNIQMQLLYEQKL